MKLYENEHTAEAANRIVNAFRQPESLPQALAPIFIHRKDDVPCRKWSWQNQLIAALCGTVDARGFRQWEAAGRRIKKGSKAFYILAPCVKQIKERNDKGEEVERRVLYGFKGIPVFAIEDTEGKPLPATDDRYGSWMQELPLLEVAQSWGVTVGTYSGSDATPLGYFRHGTGGQAIMLGVENLSTWAHECIHCAGDRLAGTRPKLDRAHEEIVAELGGAVLLECLGMSRDADLGGAYAYIQRYAAETKKDTVKVCIDLIRDTCERVKLILDTAEALQQQSAVVAA